MNMRRMFYRNFITASMSISWVLMLALMSREERKPVLAGHEKKDSVPVPRVKTIITL